MKDRNRAATLATMIEARKAATGESDAAAGRACGVVQATFTRWRTGALSPNAPERVDALAAWLGVRPDDVSAAIAEGRRQRPAKPRAVRSILADLAQQTEAHAAALERLAAVVESLAARLEEATPPTATRPPQGGPGRPTNVRRLPLERR